jgi:hypothetical protein
MVLVLGLNVPWFSPIAWCGRLRIGGRRGEHSDECHDARRHWNLNTVASLSGIAPSRVPSSACVRKKGAEHVRSMKRAGGMGHRHVPPQYELLFRHL